MSDSWEGTESQEDEAKQIVAGLVRLAQNDEAARLLGVDGTLEDEVDVTFLNDPLAWIANEIAGAIRAEDEEGEVVALSTLVALLRLYRILRGGTLTEQELLDAVLEYLGDEDET